MRYDDTDLWMEREAEQEALENRRGDADAEMAAMNRFGDALHAAEKAGRCTHGTTVSYRKPAAYPEQEGLKPGQCRCKTCLRVFGSDDEWLDEIDRAVEGTP